MSITEAFTAYILEEIRLKHKAYKTEQNYKTTLHSFVRCNADLPINFINFEHILRWKLYMDQQGYSSSTMAHSLAQLRCVFKYLKRRKFTVMDTDEIELPKVVQKAPVWLDYSEIQAMLDVIESVRDKAIVTCLFSTGCRISELLNLNKEDIYDNHATVTGKGGKYGTVYFDQKAIDALNEYLESRKDTLKPLFVSGQRRRITVSRVQQLLHEYADAAGIDKNVTPHVFRHSFASDLKRNGADLYDIKELLRHQRISSTMIYTHFTDLDIKNVHDKFHSK